MSINEQFYQPIVDRLVKYIPNPERIKQELMFLSISTIDSYLQLLVGNHKMSDEDMARIMGLYLSNFKRVADKTGESDLFIGLLEEHGKVYQQVLSDALKNKFDNHSIYLGEAFAGFCNVEFHPMMAIVTGFHFEWLWKIISESTKQYI